MKLPESDLGCVERQFRERIGLGYCKACREWDVLILPKRLCFDCLKLRLRDIYDGEYGRIIK